MAVVCAPRTGVPCAVLVGARGTRTLQPSEKSNDRDAGQLDTFFFMATKAFSFISKAFSFIWAPRRNTGCPTFLQTCSPTNSESLSFFRRSGAGTLRGDQGTPLPPSSGGGTRQNSPPQSRGDWTPRRAQRGRGSGTGSAHRGRGQAAPSALPLAESPGLAGARHGPGPPPWQCLQPAALLS